MRYRCRIVLLLSMLAIVPVRSMQQAQRQQEESFAPLLNLIAQKRAQLAQLHDQIVTARHAEGISAADTAMLDALAKGVQACQQQYATLHAQGSADAHAVAERAARFTERRSFFMRASHDLAIYNQNYDELLARYQTYHAQETARATEQRALEAFQGRFIIRCLGDAFFPRCLKHVAVSDQKMARELVVSCLLVVSERLFYGVGRQIQSEISRLKTRGVLYSFIRALLSGRRTAAPDELHLRGDIQRMLVEYTVTVQRASDQEQKIWASMGHVVHHTAWPDRLVRIARNELEPASLRFVRKGRTLMVIGVLSLALVYDAYRRYWC